MIKEQASSDRVCLYPSTGSLCFRSGERKIGRTLIGVRRCLQVEMKVMTFHTNDSCILELQLLKQLLTGDVGKTLSAALW